MLRCRRAKDRGVDLGGTESSCSANNDLVPVLFPLDNRAGFKPELTVVMGEVSPAAAEGVVKLHQRKHFLLLSGL